MPTSSLKSRLFITAGLLTGAIYVSQPGQAQAQAASATGSGSGSPTSTIGEVVVTASRRSESVTKLPFNISAYGAQELRKSNVTSVTALSEQVPNFIIQDQGARSAASAIPIIRGLNASQPVQGYTAYNQPPVGFYFGNAPLVGYHPLMDLERVEVLRGPQGTLYGAGDLGGAVRIVPAAPKLDAFGASLSVSAAAVSHSSKADYDVDGEVNLPLGSQLALRIAAKHQYDAGFIDQNDILERAGGNYINGAPVLANPADVASSSGVYFNKKDVNFTRTDSVRAELLWRPSDKLSLQATYAYTHIEGDGGPLDGSDYGGGVSPFDPNVTFAPTGQYQISSLTLEPYHRDSHLGILDASYDLGFATVSSTVAYNETRGFGVYDGTAQVLGTVYGPFYTGTPSNPRIVIPTTRLDTDKLSSEELRIVSREGADRTFDYVAGLYFEQERRNIGLSVYAPGADTQSAAANGGSTLPMIEGGTYVPLFADGSTYNELGTTEYDQYSVYGDLTWHVTPAWSITGGARYFYETYKDNFSQAAALFEFTDQYSSSTSFSSPVFKANTTYQLDSNNRIYATFSQGFRRGGSNAFQRSGPFSEPDQLTNYQPDKANNYEIGLKGRLWGLRYAADLFYIDWQKPQIFLSTPVNTFPIVVNGASAASKGAEFELSGPIANTGFSFNLGFAYAHARLTKSFMLPAGDGNGGVIADGIVGQKGDRLPGAPDFSGALTVDYRYGLSNGSSLDLSFGADYRSSTINNLAELNPNLPASTAPGYALLHGSVDWSWKTWDIALYGTNLADTHVVFDKPVRTVLSRQLFGAYGDGFAVARPREIGLRITRTW